jgi:hypothetical protein
MVNRYNCGQIWSIPCPSTSATVIQTTACSSAITSPTGANPFLVSNADNYPVPGGKEISILWNLTASGTVSIWAYSSSSTTATTVAGGSFFSFPTFNGQTSLTGEQIAFPTWAPLRGLPRPFSRARQALSRLAGQYTREIIDDAGQKVTSISPSINVLLPSCESVFFNVNQCVVTIQWSPSNASTTSIQVTPGMLPDSSNNVYIASR